MGKLFKLKRQSVDKRDHKHFTVSKNTNKPSRFALNVPPPLDQGNIGSCALNATAIAYWHLLSTSRLPPVYLSRLYLYYNTRVGIEKESPINDCGVELRDVFKAMNTYNICNEGFWPYNTMSFSTLPSCNAYKNAVCRPISYKSVAQDLESMKATLTTSPIIFGICVYTSFVSDSVSTSGIVPLPDTNNEEFLGGHALLLYGYDDDMKTFLALNSWGSSWGKNGSCVLPYNFVLDPTLAFDFWVINLR